MSLSSDTERKGQKRKLADALNTPSLKPEPPGEASGEPVLVQVANLALVRSCPPLVVHMRKLRPLC